MGDPAPAQGNVAKIKDFFQGKINALEQGANNLNTNVQSKGTSLVESVKGSITTAKNKVAAGLSVEPSPQGGPLATGLGGPAQGGRRRRARKSKKSTRKGSSKKRSSKKGKKRSTKKRVRFSRRK
jgi:hypothetical protein